MTSVSNSEIQKQLELFWMLDDYPKNRLLTNNEQDCETCFVDNVKRDNAGHFIVKLPLKNDQIYFEGS